MGLFRKFDEDALWLDASENRAVLHAEAASAGWASLKIGVAKAPLSHGLGPSPASKAVETYLVRAFATATEIPAESETSTKDVTGESTTGCLCGCGIGNGSGNATNHASANSGISEASMPGISEVLTYMSRAAEKSATGAAEK